MENAREDRRHLRQKALGYTRAHEEVRDVLLSGGDTLTLNDGQLRWLLEHIPVHSAADCGNPGTAGPKSLSYDTQGESVAKYHHGEI